MRSGVAKTRGAPRRKPASSAGDQALEARRCVGGFSPSVGAGRTPRHPTRPQDSGRGSPSLKERNRGIAEGGRPEWEGRGALEEATPEKGRLWEPGRSPAGRESGAGRPATPGTRDQQRRSGPQQTQCSLTRSPSRGGPVGRGEVRAAAASPAGGSAFEGRSTPGGPPLVLSEGAVPPGAHHFGKWGC